MSVPLAAVTRVVVCLGFIGIYLDINSMCVAHRTGRELPRFRFELFHCEIIAITFKTLLALKRFELIN